MWEIIKMIFFWGMFLFGIFMALLLLYWRIEERIANLELERNSIGEKKYKDEIESLKSRNRFLEWYWSERMRKYYELSIKYYDILSLELFWKSVAERRKEDQKVSREVYPKKKKTKWKKSSE